MGADYEIEFAGFELFEDLAAFSGGNESVEEGDVDIEAS